MRTLQMATVAQTMLQLSVSDKSSGVPPHRRITQSVVLFITRPASMSQLPMNFFHAASYVESPLTVESYTDLSFY